MIAKYSGGRRVDHPSPSPWKFGSSCTFIIFTIIFTISFFEAQLWKSEPKSWYEIIT